MITNTNLIATTNSKIPTRIISRTTFGLFSTRHGKANLKTLPSCFKYNMSANLDNAWGDEEGLDISDDGFGWEDDDDLFGNSEDANNTSHIIDVPEIKGIEEDNDDNDNGEDDDSRLGFPSATPVTASIPPPVSSPSPTEEESQIGWEDDDNLFGNSEDDGYGEEVLETTTIAAANFQRSQSKNLPPPLPPRAHRPPWPRGVTGAGPRVPAVRAATARAVHAAAAARRPTRTAAAAGSAPRTRAARCRNPAAATRGCARQSPSPPASRPCDPTRARPPARPGRSSPRAQHHGTGRRGLAPSRGRLPASSADRGAAQAVWCKTSPRARELSRTCRTATINQRPRLRRCILRKLAADGWHSHCLLAKFYTITACAGPTRARR